MADKAFYGQVQIVQGIPGGGVLCRHCQSRWWPQRSLRYADGRLNPDDTHVDACADLMQVMGAMIPLENGFQPLTNLTGSSEADPLNIAELGGGCRYQALQVAEVVDDPLDCA